MAQLSDIITSKVRIKILELFLSNVSDMYHVRGIVREIGEEINAVRRELEKMEASGILKKESRGNRIYYWANPEYGSYSELLSLVAKSKGLGGEIIQNRKRIGRLNYVMFSGKFVRRKERKREDDVDILVVGEVTMPELAALIRKEESKRNKEINYTVMSKEELDFRKKRKDPFLGGILSGSRIMIIGDDDDLVT